MDYLDAEQFGVKQSHADTAYEITTPILEAILSTDSYHSFKYAIDEKGFYIIRRDDQRIKVYSPELMAIFTTENLPVLERNKETDTTINGKYYLEFYLKGYNEGATYFKENYTLPPNVLYGENAKQYVMNLHHNCFHKEIRFGFNGWYSFKKSYPTLISQKVIKEFGYYAGIISKVEELASNHPKLFETFENCEQSENSESGTKEIEVQKTAKGKPELTLKVIALKHFYEGKQITRKNANEIAKQYGHNSGEALFQDYSFFSSTANRKAKPDLCTPKKLKNKIELFEQVLSLLPIEKQARIKDELNILKNMYETDYQ